MTTDTSAPNTTPAPKRNRHAPKTAKELHDAYTPNMPELDPDSLARAYLEKKKRESDEARKKNMEDFQDELSELINRRGIGIDIEVRELYGPDGNIKAKSAGFLFYNISPKEPGAGA